jgi:cell division control protein 45
MLLKRDKTYEAYEMIKEQAAAGGCTVLILSAADCDSMAATRILSYMLRSDNIQNTIQPVSSTRDLERCRTQLEAGEIRSVFMVNCGAIVDVKEVFMLTRDDDIRCFILDSHRPVHLANIHAHEDLVVVMDDGILGEIDFPVSK